MPTVYPRASVLLAPGKTAALRRELGFSSADLRAPLDNLVEQALARSAADGPVLALRAHRPHVEQAADALANALSRHPGPGRDMSARFHERLIQQLDRLERALLHADRQSVDAVRARVTRLANTLAPHRKPQERVYSIVSFLFEHGWELVPRLLAAIPHDPPGPLELDL